MQKVGTRVSRSGDDEVEDDGAGGAGKTIQGIGICSTIKY